MSIYEHDKQVSALCGEIEKLPASEQQTKVSMLAAELHLRVRKDREDLSLLQFLLIRVRAAAMPVLKWWRVARLDPYAELLGGMRPDDPILSAGRDVCVSAADLEALELAVSSTNVFPNEQTGAELISAERYRQIYEEGWTEEHDDQHEDAELAWAACYYAMPCLKVFQDTVFTPHLMFPETWDESWAKRRGYHDRVRDLVKAGALIAAEIDRLRRQL